MKELRNKANKMILLYEQAYSLIDQVIRESFPNKSITTQIYGSFATKLLIPSSDIDLNLTGFGSIDNKKRVSILTRLSKILDKQAFITEVNPILTAYVPVIKIKALIDFAKTNKLSKIN